MAKKQKKGDFATDAMTVVDVMMMDIRNKLDVLVSFVTRRAVDEERERIKQEAAAGPPRKMQRLERAAALLSLEVLKDRVGHADAKLIGALTGAFRAAYPCPFLSVLTALYGDLSNTAAATKFRSFKHRVNGHHGRVLMSTRGTGSYMTKEVWVDG